jgi:glycosidase
MQPRWLAALVLGLAPWLARAEDCRPDPLAGRTLYLRGSMSSWAPIEDYAFEYRCNAWVLNVDLAGRQEFKIADADWSPATNFGDGGDGRIALGGGNLSRTFDGPHTLRFTLDDGQPALGIGPRSAPGPARRSVDDPVALSLRFDSRSALYKQPFGAVPAGTTVRFSVAARPGVAALTLVVEKRLLEGNQDKLGYTEVARAPMRKGPQGWQARYRFADKAVYGYWFEARIGGQTYALHNNNDSIAWTRERGSGGLGVVSAMPASVKPIRRFRQTVYDPAFKVPDWAADAVYYQIFPDRFRNGDPRNDPRPGVDRYQAGTVELHTNWLDKPWRPSTGDGSDSLYSNDFYGGDIAGIVDKLDDLRDLGVNTLYITPMFKAASNHKYDTADFLNIDPAFGSNEDFSRLTREAARRGLRVIPDTSLNHTGSDSIYFDRYGNHGSNGAFEGGRVNPGSPYAGWFRFDTAQASPDRQYKGWGGPELPEIDKTSPDFRRFAYRAPDSVMKRWLDRGAAGWRMDVAPWVPDDFWREWRTAVKQHRPDAMTIAETWFDASKYLLGDMFDSTMNYIFRNAVLDYAAGGAAGPFVAQMELMREAYPPQAFQALMNLVSSHDVARALHVLGWEDEKADAATVARAKQRLKLATFIQMTHPGAPCIYYGDEVGVTGGADPYNRAPYPWPDLGGQPDTALRATFRDLITLRREHAVLRRGTLEAPLFVDAHVVVQPRRLGRTLALTAINNAEAERTLSLTLPPGLRRARWIDAVTGEPFEARGGRLALTLPASYGRVLLAR